MAILSRRIVAHTTAGALGVALFCAAYDTPPFVMWLPCALRRVLRASPPLEGKLDGDRLEAPSSLVISAD